MERYILVPYNESEEFEGFETEGKFAETCLNGIKKGIDYIPDYWTHLEHTYAGMAMQGILSNPHIAFKDIKVDTVTDVYVDNIVNVAHALVEKMKKERK